MVDFIFSYVPLRPFVAICLVVITFGFGPANSAAMQVRYGTVALSGQPAPGVPAGVNYAPFETSDPLPAVNNVGQLVYNNSLAAPGGLAIFAGPSAAPQLVARTGNSAPGTPPGVVYSDVQSPTLGSAGQAAHFAYLMGGGVTIANDQAIFGGPLAAPQLVARTGDAAPGTAVGVAYFNLRPPVLNQGGHIAYLTDLLGDTVTGTNDQAIYAGPLAAPQLIARDGDPAPGLPAGVNYSTLDRPVLNDAGHAAFATTLTGASVTSLNDSAIFAGAPAAPQLVARTGNVAPGTPVGVNYLAFAPFHAPTLNNIDQVAYSAFLTGSGVTDANNAAIYAGALVAPQLVARTGDAAPGMPAGVSYSSLSNPPALNNNGHVVYGVSLAGAGVTNANNTAIYSGPVDAVQPVVRGGDTAPGTPAGVNYLSVGPAAINDAGQLAYIASLTGSGVTFSNDFALFAYHPTLDGVLIVREGSSFDVGGGDFRTIAHNGIAFDYGGRHDKLTGLSNDGTLAFRLTFTNGTSGIFTAKIVPEPTALTLLAAAGMLLIVARRLSQAR